MGADDEVTMHLRTGGGVGLELVVLVGRSHHGSKFTFGDSDWEVRLSNSAEN
jgi:hypothetical protein